MLWSGIRVGGDTGIYVDGATALLDGQPLTERQPSYVGYIAVIAALQLAGAGLIGVVAAQLAAATFAAFAVHRMAVELGGRPAGGLAVLLFAVDVDTNRWHAFILSDSLFISALAVTAWLVHRATARPGGAGGYLTALLALVVAASIRPEGWFVIPAAALYWLLRSRESAARRATLFGAAALTCAVLAAVVAPRLGGNVAAVGPGEMLRRGQTIWEYDGWRVAMPDDPVLSSPRGAAAAAAYAMRHPISTARLMAARLAVHAAHVRPFYSTAHNLLIAAWLLPLYACFALGAWALRRTPLVWWGGAVLATQSLVVALTHADWDGRYLAHVMPLVYPCAACGLAAVLQRAVPGVHARLEAA